MKEDWWPSYPLHSSATTKNSNFTPSRYGPRNARATKSPKFPVERGGFLMPKNGRPRTKVRGRRPVGEEQEDQRIAALHVETSDHADLPMGEVASVYEIFVMALRVSPPLRPHDFRLLAMRLALITVAAQHGPAEGDP